TPICPTKAPYLAFFLVLHMLRKQRSNAFMNVARWHSCNSITMGSNRRVYTTSEKCGRHHLSPTFPHAKRRRRWSLQIFELSSMDLLRLLTLSHKPELMAWHCRLLTVRHYTSFFRH